MSLPDPFSGPPLPSWKLAVLALLAQSPVPFVASGARQAWIDYCNELLGRGGTPTALPPDFLLPPGAGVAASGGLSLGLVAAALLLGGLWAYRRTAPPPRGLTLTEERRGLHLRLAAALALFIGWQSLSYAWVAELPLLRVLAGVEALAPLRHRFLDALLGALVLWLALTALARLGRLRRLGLPWALLLPFGGAVWHRRGV